MLSVHPSRNLWRLFPQLRAQPVGLRDFFVSSKPKQEERMEDKGGDLPLVVMLDFLSEATVEQKVLDGVARVEAWNVQSESSIPWEKVRPV